MASELNIDTDSSYTSVQKQNIEGGVYYLVFMYNYRQGWYANLYDETQTPLHLSVQVMRGRSLFEGISEFTGSFIVMDTDPVAGDAVVGRDNFGTGKRFQVWYFSADEITSLKDGTFEA